MKIMQSIKVMGIIVSETNYSESSKILNILTRDLGIISVISKGCRKLKSKLRSVSTKLTYGEFIISYKKDGLSTLIDVNSDYIFRNIMSDINTISYVSFIVELATQVAKQNNDANIFDILITALKKIELGLDPFVILLIVELKYLNYLGLSISLDCCSNCGNSNNIVTLSSDRGGYICSNCYQNELIVTKKSIKIINLLYHVELNNVTKIALSDKTKQEINSFLDEYYDKYSGLYLKSKHFIKLII